MNIYIKNMGVLLSSIYYFLRISKLKVTRYLIFKLILFVLLMGFLVSIVDYYYSYFAIPFALIVLIFFMCINVYTIKKEYVIIESIISFAIGYVLFNISTLLTAGICLMIPDIIVHIWGQIICLLILIILLPIPLSLKRFKHGMTFLNNQLYYIQGLIGSCLIIVLSPLINNGLSNWKYIIYYLLFFTFSVLLFLYWRASITRHYLERLSLRNIDSLNAELDEKNDYIRRLTEDKDRLEKINHRNYKLVPAMQGAVTYYLQGVSSFIEGYTDNPAFAELALTCEEGDVGDKFKEYIAEGNRLLEELNRINSEWKKSVDSENVVGEKNIPSCGITRVDYILSYMYERSKKEDFSIKVDIDDGFNEITEKKITEEELATLIADLIENAIIANRHNNGKEILVRLGIMKKEYIVEVYDSGIAFDKEVLLKFGLEKITTHSDENGSGIGMMQTYEILNKYGASLYIDELSDDTGLFTKRIVIVFNRKNQYVLYTNRSDEEVAYLNKRSDLMVIKR